MAKRSRKHKRKFAPLLSLLAITNIVGVGFAAWANGELTIAETGYITGNVASLGGVPNGMEIVSITASSVAPTGFVFKDEINEKIYKIEVAFTLNLSVFKTVAPGGTLENKNIVGDFEIRMMDPIPFNVFLTSTTTTLYSKYSFNDFEKENSFLNCDSTNITNSSTSIRAGSFVLSTTNSEKFTQETPPNLNMLIIVEVDFTNFIDAKTFENMVYDGWTDVNDGNINYYCSIVGGVKE